MAGVRIKDLATRSSKLTSGDAYIPVDNGGSGVDKVEFETLAKQVIEDYEGAELAGSEQSVKDVIDSMSSVINGLMGAVGSPLVASTVAGMTDQTKIYVYTGSETGYTAGNWYYYDGSAWTSGGVYNATAAALDDYIQHNAVSGKLELTEGLVPAPGNSDALVGAHDVKMDQDDTRLDDAFTDLKGAISLDSFIKASNFTNAYNVTYAVSDEEITVTNTGSGNYNCLQTNKILPKWLIPGETYRLYAKAEAVSGNPALIVAIRGTDVDEGQVSSVLNLKNTGEGYIDFVASSANQRVSLFVSYGSNTQNSVAKFSKLSLQCLNKSTLLNQDALIKTVAYQCSSDSIIQNVHFEAAQGGFYVKFVTLYIGTPFIDNITVSFSTIEDSLVTSPSGVTDCAFIPHNYSLIYDFDDQKLKIVPHINSGTRNIILIFKVATVFGFYGGGYDGPVGGVGLTLYYNWLTEKESQFNAGIKNELLSGNAYNLLDNISMLSRTTVGVQFKFERDGSVTLNGTSTAAGVVVYYSSTSELPSYIKKNKYYYTYYDSDSPDIKFYIRHYANDNWQGTISVSRGTFVEHYIPNDATGLMITFNFAKNVTFNNAKVTPYFFSEIPNTVLFSKQLFKHHDTANSDAVTQHFEQSIGGMYVKFTSLYITYLGKQYTTAFSTIDDETVTSPSGVTGCLFIQHNYGLYYDIYAAKLIVKPKNQRVIETDIPIFIVGTTRSYNTAGGYDGIIGGIGQSMWYNWFIEDTLTKIKPYWLDHITAKIDDIREKDVDCYGDSFVFITDVHWQSNSKKSPALIKEILKKTSVKKVFMGGDILNYNTTKAEAVSVIDSFYSEFDGIPMYSICGNHEDNGENTSAGTEEHLYPNNRYNVVTKTNPQNIETPGKTYFVLKNSRDKIAYICLDICDYVYDNDQLTWLTAQLNELAVNYHIVIMTHIYYTRSNGENVRDERAAGMLDNVISGLDQSKQNKIIAIFTGHTHEDGLYRSPQGIPVIVTNCDSWIRNSLPAQSGTTTEQSFDVVHIDLTNEMIYMTRIGAGSDRQISFRE